MCFEDVRGTPLSGKTSHHSNVSPTVRTLNVSPGSYQVSLVYEHQSQPTCWEDRPSTHCWHMQDGGWWLPGTTLSPTTIEWVAKSEKTYTVTCVKEYWPMTDQPSWSPIISMTKAE